MGTQAAAQVPSSGELQHGADSVGDGGKQREGEGYIQVRDKRSDHETNHSQRVLEEDRIMVVTMNSNGEKESENNVEVAANTRISYNSGFGDFCFGRWLDSRMLDEPRRIEDEATGKVVFKELNGFHW